MPDPTAPLIVDRDDRGVLRLTLNRPASRNALSRELLTCLAAALDSVDATTRVVVLAANGVAFSAGHDLREVGAADEASARSLFELCTSVMLRIRRLPVPVIAAVQGAAVAAGCQLAATADLAIAADSAIFGTPGVKVGLFCATPMVPLARAVPPKVALELLLTGGTLTARRAHDLGLVNRVVPGDRLEEAVEEMVAAILSAAPGAVRAGKAAYYETIDMGEVEAYAHATAQIACDAGGAEAREGIAAFLEKRRPCWPVS